MILYVEYCWMLSVRSQQGLFMFMLLSIFLCQCLYPFFSDILVSKTARTISFLTDHGLDTWLVSSDSFLWDPTCVKSQIEELHGTPTIAVDGFFWRFHENHMGSHRGCWQLHRWISFLFPAEHSEWLNGCNTISAGYVRLPNAHRPQVSYSASRCTKVWTLPLCAVQPACCKGEQLIFPFNPELARWNSKGREEARCWDWFPVGRLLHCKAVLHFCNWTSLCSERI